MGKFDFFLRSVFAVIIAFAIYTLFIWLPVNLYTEAQCLREGYPTGHVTVGLERYCSNMDGAVTVKVDRKSN